MSDEETEHALFPDCEYEIGFIHVTRFEGGSVKWCPRLFAAAELPDLDALFQMFGGGRYELIARDSTRKHIAARKVYELPGPPKPMFDAGSAPPAAAAVPAAPPVDSNGGLLAVLLPMMLQQQQQGTQLMMGMMQQQTALVTGLLNNGSQQSKEHIQSMTTLHQAFAASQQQMMMQMGNARGGGGGASATDMLKLMEFGRSLAVEKAGGDDDLLESLMEFWEGIQGFVGVGGGGETPPAAPPAPGAAAE